MTILGGHLTDIPEPHYRKWPGSSEKRLIRVSITNYGLLGAPHYYLDIVEEDNPVWDSREAGSWGRTGEPTGWRNPWDDPEGRGKQFYKRCSSLMEAKGLMEEIVKEHFCSEESEVEYDLTTYFAYLKEGD